MPSQCRLFFMHRDVGLDISYVKIYRDTLTDEVENANSGGNLVERYALVGAVVLRKAENLLGNRVEQHLIRPASNAHGRRGEPACHPIVLDPGVGIPFKTQRSHQV